MEECRFCQPTIFSLKLAVQKLEEELSLYRNGTSVRELLDLIGEKDSEIESLKKSANKQEDKLRKFAESSADVLAKCESLQKEKAVLLEKQAELLDTIERKCISIEDLNNISERAKSELGDSVKLNKELEDAIFQLQGELKDRDENIEKLQNRCAGLVVEKSEKVKALEKEKSERDKQVKEMRDEIEKAMMINIEIKDRYRREHEVNADLKSQLKTLHHSLSSSKKELQTISNQCADLKRENSQQLEFWERDKRIAEQAQFKLQQQLLDSEDKYTNDVSNKDGIIQELEDIVASTEKEFREYQATSAAEAVRAAAEHAGKVSALEDEARSVTHRLRQVEGERTQLLMKKMETDTLRARVKELEEKVQRQEQYTKNRLLKEKSLEPQQLPPSVHTGTIGGDLNAAAPVKPSAHVTSAATVSEQQQSRGTRGSAAVGEGGKENIPRRVAPSIR